MNRPLALIQGDLALPNARLLSGLPPPFGVKRNLAQTAARHEPPSGAAGGAHQAMLAAVQRRTPSTHQISFAPGARYAFLYKLPEPRDHRGGFDTQLAEARRYLEMGNARPRSSRSDHAVGAAIFLSCSLALAWLLSTCATRSTDKVASVAITRPAAPLQGGVSVAPGTAPDTALSTAPSVAPSTAPDPVPKLALQAEPTQPSQRVEARPVARDPHDRGETRRVAGKPVRRAAIARLTDAQADKGLPERLAKRMAIARAVPSLTRPSLSTQPEWTAHPSSSNDTPERTALLDWAAQQRRANVTTRAATPTPTSASPADADWNARMTQRRITDNPGAFQIGRAQP